MMFIILRLLQVPNMFHLIQHDSLLEGFFLKNLILLALSLWWNLLLNFFITLVTLELLIKLKYDFLFAAATKEVIKRGAMYTVLGGLLSALSTPLSVLGATDLIDSRWAIAIDRCYWFLLLHFPFNTYKK